MRGHPLSKAPNLALPPPHQRENRRSIDGRWHHVALVLEATGREVLADLTVRKDKNDDTKFYQQVGRIHAA